MESDVRLVRVPAVPTAVVRRTVQPRELSTVVPACCGTVAAFLRARRVRAGRNVAVYFDGAVRLEAGMEVLGAFAAEGDVVASSTPEGQAVTATHHGPYQGLGAAHEAIRRWSTSRGLRLQGANWEVYGHWEEAWNADPSLIRTDVFYQVAPA